MDQANRKPSKITFSHPWLAKTFKGPGSNILGLDFSPNGKYMIACSEGKFFFQTAWLQDMGIVFISKAIA
jgi:hypothetical protein